MKNKKSLLEGLKNDFANKKAKSIDEKNVFNFLDAFKESDFLTLEIEYPKVFFEQRELFTLDKTAAPEYNAYSVVRDILNLAQLSSEFITRKETEQRVKINRKPL